ncbi:MAG: 4Fe-4S binding protein [Firmicutes bacterium]|nr:4Fe-4S binding protein [Bacillota bacterium]
MGTPSFSAAQGPSHAARYCAQVLEALCQGCGNCARACPRQAIAVVAKKARVQSTLCDGCETCLDHCLNGALTFVACP